MNVKVMLAVVIFGFTGTVLVLAAERARDTSEVAAVTPVPKKPPPQEQSAAVDIRVAPQKVAQELPQAAIQVAATSKPTDALPISSRQLDALLAPVALYPDQLLSQILMASTYPLEVIEAARWVVRPENEGLTGDRLADALDGRDWDPSVKALAAFPQILKMMDADLDWLSKLGDAFITQQAAVMDSVQRLRREARAADKLDSDTRRRVTIDDDQIVIEPANPEVVYVPFYDPRDVYGAWPYPDYPPAYIPPPLGYAYTPGIYYSFGAVSPFWGWSRWDWRQRRIHIDPPRHNDHNHSHSPNPGNGHVWQHDPNRDHGNNNFGNGFTGRGPRGNSNVGNSNFGDSNPVNNNVGSGNFGNANIGNDGRFRGVQPRDAEAAPPIHPREREFHGGPPGRLPDLSPPLPASAKLPDIAPPVSTAPQPAQQPDRTEDMRRRRFEEFRQRQEQQRQLQQEQQEVQQQENAMQEARRHRQFQDPSIGAPALSNVPPTQQQRMRDPSIGAPPLTNIPPPNMQPQARQPVFAPPVQAVQPLPPVQPQLQPPQMNMQNRFQPPQQQTIAPPPPPPPPQAQPDADPGNGRGRGPRGTSN